jgi:molybdopterin/thiamine biosynthesis adenylyltransferase
MSQQLINLSPDLKRLRDEGYEIEVSGGYLIIHHIPYLNSNKEIKYGKLISSLTLNNDRTLKPDNHVIGFMGEYPCNKDGSIITAIQHANPNQNVFRDITMNYLFSNKPANGYDDYYQKATKYIEIIMSQAFSIDKSITAKTFKPIADERIETVFTYIDTNSSRANINQFNTLFNSQKIGIIGLGGTGSYILDLVAKTPVNEIRIFDDDLFLQHNAFRSPGAPSIEMLGKQLSKVEYLSSIYSNMHKCITPYNMCITVDNVHQLEGLSYVFICIDKNEARVDIIRELQRLSIPFIDVGIGINIIDNNLMGMARVTVGTPIKCDHINNRIGGDDIQDNEYATNIQIADLNCLNATLAVIKWKKLSGFYQDLKEEHNIIYSTNTSQLINNDFTT